MRVLRETVAFRYSDEDQIMLTGEAEVVLVLTGSHSEAGVNLHSIRIDIISLYNAEGTDVYRIALADQTLKEAVENAAMEHYFCPPSVPVGLPGHSEW